MAFRYKMQQILLQHATAVLLQNASGFLLQNVTDSLENTTVVTNCSNFLRKCDSYYRMRRFLQILTVDVCNKYNI